MRQRIRQVIIVMSFKAFFFSGLVEGFLLVLVLELSIIVDLTVLMNPNSLLCWTLAVEWLLQFIPSEEKRFLMLPLLAGNTPEAVFMLSL